LDSPKIEAIQIGILYKKVMAENPLFFIPTISGLIFIIAGIVLLKFPPKKINAIYGYRTSSSMKSQERWDFAQIYSAKETIKLGLFFVLCGFIGFVIHPNEIIGTILGMGFLTSMIIILIIRVELAIKKKFKRSE
jgi:hypothetical protein